MNTSNHNKRKTPKHSKVTYILQHLNISGTKSPKMSKKYKIHQYLRESGQFKSKTEIIHALESGDIKIAEKIIKNPEYQFKATEQVFHKNELITKPQEHLYFLLHKPIGYICHKLAYWDKVHEKKSIFELLPLNITTQDINSLTCVGRLDEDTSGLLIITTDGKLNHYLTSPENNIRKKYGVTLNYPLSAQDKREIENGIVITLEEEGQFLKTRTKPSIIHTLTPTTLEITLTEGKKREIRRIFEAVHNQVITLQRTHIGNLELHKELPEEGTIKQVTKEYILEKVGKKHSDSL